MPSFSKPDHHNGAEQNFDDIFSGSEADALLQVWTPS
jgi:hypothetical protein